MLGEAGGISVLGETGGISVLGDTCEKMLKETLAHWKHDLNLSCVNHEEGYSLADITPDAGWLDD